MAHPYRKFLLIGFISLTVSVLPSLASLIPNLDLPALARDSDLIAVGQVIGVREDGPTTVNIQGNILSARGMEAELKLDRLLKGQISSSAISVRFSLPRAPVNYGWIANGQFGVFFLHQGGDGYHVLDPYHPFVVAAPEAPSTNGSALDKITAELAYVITSGSASSQTRRDAVEALSTLKTVKAGIALQAAAHESEVAPQVLAIVALLERGDKSWIEPAAAILLSREKGLEGFLLWRLSAAIEEQKSVDPRAIPTLVRLLNSPDVPVRRAGAQALRNMRNRAAIRPLVGALRDSDQDVQYQAVIGLAEINGVTGEWAPGTELFNKDPEHYLKHWQEWAKQNTR